MLSDEWLYLTENPPSTITPELHVKDIVSVRLVSSDIVSVGLVSSKT